MTTPHKPAKPVASQAFELRRRAEEKAREKAVGLPMKSKALSPEQTNKTLHELRLHQIELEMQNEELRRAQTELDASRARYFELYDLAPVGYCTINENGLILEANFTAATMLGVARGSLVKQPLYHFVLKDDQDIYYRYRKQLCGLHAAKQYIPTCELRMVKNDETIFWAWLEATAIKDADGAPICRVMLSNVTERKMQAEEREQSARLIALINTPGDFRERMAALTASLQSWSGCEAVGIRLRDGDDYPYYETRGFPPTFVQEENQLCARDADSNILRNADGTVVLECMCGNILCGRFNSTKPFFTAHGSFWSNSTTALLASTTDADRQARTRNRCNGAGYESVALVPLRTVQQVFGLLQFNDHRTQRFTPELIASFEHMADNLAIALSRRQTEELLRVSDERYRTLVDQISDGIVVADPEGRYLSANPAFLAMLGYSIGELTRLHMWDVVAQDKQEQLAVYHARVLNAANHLCEWRLKRKDGSEFPVEVNAKTAPDARRMAIIRDITERKRVEEALRLDSQIMANMADGMYLIRASDGVIVHANDRLEKMFGYAYGELIGQNVSVIIAHSAPKETARTIIDELNRNNVWTGEIQSMRKDGATFWCSASITSFEHSCYGKVWIAVHHDISARKQAEDKLRERNEELATILDVMPSIVWIGLDPECRVITGNRAANEFTQTAAGTNVSQSMVGQGQAAYLRQLKPDGSEYRVDELPMQVAIARGTPVRDAELRFCFQDGRIADTFGNAAPLFDVQGRIRGAVAAFTDITARTESDAALRESRQSLELALQGGELGMWDWNPQTGAVIYSDRWAQMLEYLPEEVIPHEKFFQQHLHPEDLPAVLEHVAAHIEGRMPTYQSEHRLRTKSGGWLWVLDRGKIVERDNDGRPIRVTGIIADVSERKRAEEALLEQMSELRRFHNLTVGRELKMIELKKEINALRQQLGQAERYRIFE